MVALQAQCFTAGNSHEYVTAIALTPSHGQELCVHEMLSAHICLMGFCSTATATATATVARQQQQQHKHNFALTDQC